MDDLVSKATWLVMIFAVAAQFHVYLPCLAAILA